MPIPNLNSSENFINHTRTTNDHIIDVNEPSVSSSQDQHDQRNGSISIDRSHDKNKTEFNVIYKPITNSYEHVITNVKPPADLSAMSVLSLYQSTKDLDDEMDTSDGFEEAPTVPISQVDDEAGSVVENLDNTANLLPTDPKPSSSSCPCTQKHEQLVNCPMPVFHFNDQKRSIDFILVWDSFTVEATTELATERRRIFEENLRKEGLELEYEPADESGLNFIKIHAPREVLRRYSEILKLRMPMKEDLCSIQKADRVNKLLHATQIISRKIPGLQDVHVRTNTFIDDVNSCWKNIMSKIYVDKTVFPERSRRFTAVYSRDREYLFDLDSPCFFTPAIHSRIVQFILDRKRFSENVHDDFAFGIERLINEDTYCAAYPLHDGDLRQPGSMRHLLYQEWASLRKWYRYQPLDYVKEYFGVKIALYFAWLGFYTHMLVPASIVGILCFIYSCVTLNSYKPALDICNENLKIQMCPLCDHWCEYWDLKQTCVHSRITYLFDNPTTVFFAIFMSFWATLFLEMWKRYSAEITHLWDLTGFDVKEEHPRPQYLARLAHVKRRRINIVTNQMEPLVPFWRVRVPATIFSFSVVLLLVALAVAAVIAVVLYRMSVLTALSWYGSESVIPDASYAILFTTATAASINLCCIMIFNWIYTYVAEFLTEFELLRTQTEFDDSLALKIYLLQFVNYYASIFYIAFFKGKFVGYPGNYNRLFGYRQEECGPGGCLLELCMQLAIIMVGKQAMNTVLEMILPIFYKWFYSIQVKTGIKREQLSMKNAVQWVKDFKLLDWGTRGLFAEYLEMVLQYGFVTIFVAAFPLAPFFALLNNILEMRLDAKKLLTFYRRPVTQRVRDIGVWYRILDSIGKLSVITNGFIIAFTSEFIPRLIHRIYVSEDASLNGYLNNSLAYFNTSDFQVRSAPRNMMLNVTLCRYPDYREPPWSDNRYAKTTLGWQILAARLIFVVVFENVVALVMIFVRWCIPDMSQELSDRIRRETYITNEIIIKQEMLRAQSDKRESMAADSETATHTRNFMECPTTPEHWEHWLNKSLSGSDFDLILHAENPESFHEESRRRSLDDIRSTTV